MLSCSWAVQHGHPANKFSPKLVGVVLCIIATLLDNVLLHFSISFSWENRQQYVNAISQLRSEELLNYSRMQSVRAGLATVIPIQLLMIMSPNDLEMRICGMPTVNIEFLKVNFVIPLPHTHT